MKGHFSARTVVRFAVAVGASTALLTVTATPAFAAPASGMASGSPTLWCTNCNDGTIGVPGPGVGDGEDGGWGVSHNIGKGREDQERNRPHPKTSTKK